MTTTLHNQPKNDIHQMESLFAERMDHIPRSFIREILKLATKNDVISFAGGVPNPDLFPIDQIKNAVIDTLNNDGQNALQYSTTEGYLPLREFIADRYKTKRGIDISPDEILITNGSQQGLDLIGKVFLNHNDGVLLERPSYLGAIQSLSAYQPKFYNADLHPDGIDTNQVIDLLWENAIKLFYTIPDFQNPTGCSYSLEKRMEVASILKNYSTIIVEDNPYEEIRFEGEILPSFKNLLPDQTVLLGSFSKIIAPGLRLGWIACKKEYMDKLVIAKQAADLHTNFFSQMILHSYLINEDLDEHISKIREAYKKQRDTMIQLLKEHLSPKIKYTEPKGGLFIWLTLPEHCNTTAIIEEAIKEGVAYVPGNTFYQNGDGENTIRLSYSKLGKEEMSKGIMKLGRILNRYI